MGLIISLILLKSAKNVYNSNTDLILETIKVEEEERRKAIEVKKEEERVVAITRRIYYCPRCKARVEADLTACSSCNQDLKEIPPITWQQLDYKYCPRCKKNVKPKGKISTCCCIFIIILFIQATFATMIFGNPIFFITPVVILIFSLIIGKLKCSICGKGVEDQRPESFKLLSTPQAVQARPVDQKFCTNCGNVIKPSVNKFCEYCGVELKN